MFNKKRLIVLGVLIIVIVIVTSISATIAFMKPIDNGENLTSVSLSSCAKIKLTSTSSIDISNSYPMSRNKGLQTTPYSFTVTSYCDSYVGFNMYIAILEDSTIDLKNIHYVITNKGSKTALQEGLLSELEEVTTFSENEKVELRTGIKGNFSKIYNLYSGKVPLKGNREYDLYLFIDENATNDVMGKTFKVGIAVKSYEREKYNDITDSCLIDDKLGDCLRYLGNDKNEIITNLYYHDGTLKNGINDGSYRYAGASDKVNNFVCFGSDEEECPNNNLYRIIGVIDGKLKLIKYDYAIKEDLKEDGDKASNLSSICQSSSNCSNYKGTEEYANVNTYFWNYSTKKQLWAESQLNKINLNINYLNSFSIKWQNMIENSTWYVSGTHGYTPYNSYQNEIKNSNLTYGLVEASNNNTNSKIGLMYISDYGYATSPEAWTSRIDSLSENYVLKNWMYMGLSEWTISPYTGNDIAVNIIDKNGTSNTSNVGGSSTAIRPVFYLINSVKYFSGNGTKESPIRIM